jgi:glyoxylase-like metal-dependent hydrolase (beta-lactamase superfamily II)
MREVAPGVVHWTARHERIHVDVSSYLIVDCGVLLDPMAPAEGFSALAERFGAPRAVILTNRHHYRHAGEVQAAFDTPVYCHEAGMHEFTHGERVTPFAFGDTLPGGAVAERVAAICPDETAIWFAAERALAFADGLVRMPSDAPLGFVPDRLIGDDPDSVKHALRVALRRLVPLDPQCLLFAHGKPWVTGAAEALAAFAGKSDR